jgi:hypothetical protein
MAIKLVYDNPGTLNPHAEVPPLEAWALEIAAKEFPGSNKWYLFGHWEHVVTLRGDNNEWLAEFRLDKRTNHMYQIRKELRV